MGRGAFYCADIIGDFALNIHVSCCAPLNPDKCQRTLQPSQSPYRGQLVLLAQW